MTLPSGHNLPTPQDARPRLLAAPAFCGYPTDAKAAGSGERWTLLASALTWRASWGRELWAGFKTGVRPGGDGGE